MKKIENKHFDDFPPTKLYIEDLKEILCVIENNCEEVKIRTGEYDDVSPSEIDNLVKSVHSKKFDDIYIRSYHPRLSFDFRSYGVSAYISEGDLEQHGVVSKVREIIEKRKKKYFGTVVNSFQSLPMIGFGASLIQSEWVLSAMFLAFSFLMIWPMVKYQMSHKVIILTTSNNQEKSFFARRKDELFVALIAALIGAIISFILVKYFGHA